MQANYLLTERNGDLGTSADVFEELSDIVAYLDDQFFKRANLGRDIPPGSPTTGTPWDRDKAVYDAQCQFIRTSMTARALKEGSFCFCVDNFGRCWRTDAHSEGRDDWSFKVEKASPTWCHPAQSVRS